MGTYFRHCSDRRSSSNMQSTIDYIQRSTSRQSRRHSSHYFIQRWSDFRLRFRLINTSRSNSRRGSRRSSWTRLDRLARFLSHSQTKTPKSKYRRSTSGCSLSRSAFTHTRRTGQHQQPYRACHTFRPSFSNGIKTLSTIFFRPSFTLCSSNVGTQLLRSTRIQP